MMAAVESNQHPGVMVYSTSSRPLQRHLAVYDKGLTDEVTFYKNNSDYNSIKSHVGFALLLGNDRLNYSDPKPLSIRKDLEQMNAVLKEYEWHVSDPFAYSPHIKHEDYTSVMETLTENLAAYSCFMFYYSGHGSAKGLLLSDGACEPYVDIVNNVSRMECLWGKPKIFIFDSCRIPQSSSHTKNFFREITKHHHEYESQVKNYPPPDTLICFSANEGMESFSHDDYGSFYTEQLARRLRHFGEHLTLTEIITLTNGGVIKTAERNHEQQQPVLYSTLNKLLVLNSKRFHNESSVFRMPKQSDIPVDVAGYNNTEFVFLRPQRKGPNCSAVSTLSEPPDDSVVTDAVKKGTIQFRTKKDVVSNLPLLGRGKSVFICYAPDPESPYYDPEDRQGIIVRNRIYIQHLVYDLERLGFTVISDLHLGETQPKNWLQWYVSRMELCDYLIMVCSPAFKELFSCDKPQFPITDERTTWFLAYRSAMYADIIREVNESPAQSKLLPVILDEGYLAENSVPALFGMAPLYKLGSNGNRKFDYDNMMGEYERLICRMAGIDRMKLEKSTDNGVIKVANPFTQIEGKSAGIRSKARQGYKPIPWKPSSAISASKPTTQTQPPSNPLSLFSTKQTLSESHLPPKQVVESSQPKVGTTATQLSPPPPSSFPDTPPSRTIILWLCERLTNWKMIARFLGFDGSEIERISIDYDTVIEQRFQMFNSWQRHETRKYSCRTLGEVLWNSESNRHLYRECCLKVTSSGTV